MTKGFNSYFKRYNFFTFFNIFFFCFFIFCFVNFSITRNYIYFGFGGFFAGLTILFSFVSDYYFKKTYQFKKNAHSLIKNK